MNRGPELLTDRLLLRRWRASDRDPFAALNADPRVMEYLSSPRDRAASDAFVDRIEASFEQRGFGLWAVEVRDGGSFAGFTGLWPVPADLPVRGSVEVGWRLAAEHWGKGYATEAALAAVEFGFDVVRLDEIVSMTRSDNHRSRRVMEKLGLTRDPADDFDHPRANGERLPPNVVYRITADRWRRERGPGG